jgi:hypothetical protein
MNFILIKKINLLPKMHLYKEKHISTLDNLQSKLYTYVSRAFSSSLPPDLTGGDY